MRNLLALAAFLICAFLGVGYFQGWYKISTTPGADGHRSVTIELNTKKIGADVQSGTERIGQIIEKAGNDRDKKPSTVAPSPVDGSRAPWGPGVQPESPWTTPGQPTTPRFREELAEPSFGPWVPVGPPTPAPLPNGPYRER